MPPHRTLLLPALAGAALFAAAAPAQARYTSTTGAFPDYPESRIQMMVKGKPRAGGLVSLSITGTNAMPAADDAYPTPYKLDVYVHDRSVFGDCPQEAIEESSRLANLPGKVRWIGAVLPLGDGGPFAKSVTFRSTKARRTMFCAYSSYGPDSAAWGALKHDLRAKRRR